MSAFLHPPRTFGPLRSARSILLGPRLTLFGVVTLAACAASAAHLLRGALVLPLLTAAIAVAMWHGAYDQVQAEQLLRPRLGRSWLQWFLGGYLVLAAATYAGWWLLPIASLVLFLTYSAWHFGTEPEGWMPSPSAALAATALGAVPLAAACRWHGSAVVPIFTQMLYRAPNPVAAALAVSHALAALYWPTLVVSVAGVILGRFGAERRQQLSLLAVVGCVAALFLFCDPLVAFAVYFCCWHTPEHLVTTSAPSANGASLKVNLGRNLRAGFVPWVLSLALLGLVFVFGRHQAASYQAELFVALSVLTVPHMLLNELGRTRSSRKFLGLGAGQESGLS